MDQQYPDGDERVASVEQAAWLHLDSWAGRSKHKVMILNETVQRYRIKFIDEPALGWRRGEIRLVPKYAVTKRYEQL